MQGEVWRRSRFLVAWILGETWDQEVRLPDLIDGALEELVDENDRARWSAKTIENTVRDLVAFGALRVVQRGRDRILTASILGKAWIAGELLPPIGGDELEAAVTELLEVDS